MVSICCALKGRKINNTPLPHFLPKKEISGLICWFVWLAV